MEGGGGTHSTMHLRASNGRKFRVTWWSDFIERMATCKLLNPSENQQIADVFSTKYVLFKPRSLWSFFRLNKSSPQKKKKKILIYGMITFPLRWWCVLILCKETGFHVQQTPILQRVMNLFAARWRKRDKHAGHQKVMGKQQRAFLFFCSHLQSSKLLKF